VPYEKDVNELRGQYMIYPKIHKILCEKGYAVSIASLKIIMQKERARMYEHRKKARNSLNLFRENLYVN
jgi:hypothetical protein